MKALMVVGTTSHAGKSFLVTGLCRILSQQGWHVAPFKGQNMSLNAYVTSAGGEIGYAQAVQSWAAKTAPRVEMNPILLKPQGNQTSQVIFLGKVAGTTQAADYYKNYFEPGWQTIQKSLARLANEFDVVICEGAGSPAEINLKHRDLTNMRVASYLQAETILVVDIDRGGAFAHVVGTLELLEPEERQLIKGIVINKFRGQKSLLDSGIQWLEDYTKIPVLGVIPYGEQLLPPEDSLSILERGQSFKPQADLTISVLRLPHIANFTDFDPLEAESSVSVRYVYPHESLDYPDAVIIPGSKATIADLQVLHHQGMIPQLQQYAAMGGHVLGICGGYQMLGKVINDPLQLEGNDTSYPGLNLLAQKTVLEMTKVVCQRQTFSSWPQEGLPVEGYEIHQGRTIALPDTNNKALFADPELGAVSESGLVWGAYLHGLFDNGPWRRSWLNYLRNRRGLNSLPTGVSNYREQREVMLDAIADLVQKHVDLSALLPS
ncbi:MAG: cobyric acid synthase CobQ [Cyanobacteria bacterium P01_H01_bin.15]